jgi:hypothetical protein
MSNATTTAVNATSSSSASSSLLPQHQQAPVHHNNHPHPLASTLQQQLFQQSPPHTSFVNHPMMVQSLQAVRFNILINTILVFNHCITIAAMRCPWQQFFFCNIPTAAAASARKQYTVAYAVVRSAVLQQVIIRTAGL